ncbi:hypothetical protein [Actinomycetospora straminea]|uniref:hypothetical protein n=1 Tax=Actinomycetospora straminea TaxID=663607 RepID=UPI0023657B34|nr:hypothetical protein [Actinomycetospora straminea]MDD7931005.1 hypothetical protein [Actinomycetospora straminea]
MTGRLVAGPALCRLVGLLVCLLALTGCTSSFTEGTSATPARPDGSLEAARSKLGLVAQDPCYTARDVDRRWRRCGRWEEEVLNVGNAAAGARPGDREITDPAAAVRAGHERFVRGGCAAGAPPDPGVCVAAVEETRTAVTRLARGIASAR